ncbi:MBL fold metallo-hydrolase [Clostridium paraputrificum]|uniref:MBL fold metallo-hydrolase n=1 Tax=Clostridium TaxID=1485 RepID=UPI003D328C3B
MNFFSNIKFLSKLTLNNIHQYFIPRDSSLNDTLVNNSVHWYGHATTLINLSGTVILTDPVLSNTLGIFKRVVEKPSDLKDTKIDYILLSHGHMDHMDFPSLRKLDKNITIIVPKGYKRLIKLLGYKNVILLRHGEIYEDDNIKITSLKANHDGRRFYVGIDDESHSFLIEKNDKKVFFAGDTAYTDDYNDLKCDVALMPVGCYKPDRFSYMHCTPQESYKMFSQMNSDAMIPIHYKTFRISLEDFDETYSILDNYKDEKIKLINIGETYKF